MFDADTFSLADAIQNSQDYKLVRYDGWLYVFPADTDFSALGTKNKDYTALLALERNSVLLISPSGTVTRNRFGKTGATLR